MIITHIIIFIAGVALGVVILSYTSATSLDKTEQEKNQLYERIEQLEQEILLYEDLIKTLRAEKSPESDQKFLDTDPEENPTAES